MELGVNPTVPSPVSTCECYSAVTSRPILCHCLARHISFAPEPSLTLVLSGQVIMSIRCKDVHRPVIIEALRRARYKFPGRQKIVVSKKWGFTSLDRADYAALKQEKMVINDGAYVQVSERNSLLLGLVD